MQRFAPAEPKGLSPGANTAWEQEALPSSLAGLLPSIPTRRDPSQPSGDSSPFPPGPAVAARSRSALPARGTTSTAPSARRDGAAQNVTAEAG